MEFFAHAVLLCFAAFVVFNAVPGSSLFSWHPTCMILAVVLWTEGIISFRRPQPSWRVNVHWATNAIAITMAINGFLSIYNNKEKDGKQHFTTYHGLAGVVTMGLLLVQTIGGNFANFSGAIGKFVPVVRPAVIKWGHRISGALSITAVYVTLFLALSSFWFTSLVSNGFLWVGIAMCLLYCYLYAVFYANFSKPGGKPKEKVKN